MMAMREQVVSGLRWSAIGKLGTQLISWAVTVTVIRVLSPADYGLMAIISVIILFLSHANEMGLGAALVQTREASDEQAGAVVGAMLLMGTGLCLLLALAGPGIAWFFDDPRLATLVAVAGLQFIFSAIIVVPESELRRRMDFKSLAYSDMGGGLAASLSTLTLALHGAGIWALVLGNLAGAVVGSTIINVLSPRRAWPNLKLRRHRELLGFGGYMAAGRFASYFMAQADVLIGSKFLDKDALGLYSVSLHLASLPMHKTMGMVNQVAFSAIARMQDQRDVARAGIAEAIRLLAYTTLPLLGGLACLAPEFVPVVLGDHWAGAVLPLQLVAIAVPLRMLNSVFSTAVSGLGHADVDFRNMLTGVVVMPLCFLVGARWGATGLAASWMVGVPLVLLLNYRRTREVVGLSIGDLAALAARPALATALMALALFASHQAVAGRLAPMAALLSLVGIGAVTYAAAAWALDARLRQWIKATRLRRGIVAPQR